MSRRSFTFFFLIFSFLLAGSSASAQSDGKYDLFVWRPSSGVWYALLNTGDSCQPPLQSAGTYRGRPLCTQQWGLPGDVPARIDVGAFQSLAVYRPSSGEWYGIFNENPEFPHEACRHNLGGYAINTPVASHDGFLKCLSWWGDERDTIVPGNYIWNWEVFRGWYKDVSVFSSENATWHIIPGNRRPCLDQSASSVFEFIEMPQVNDHNHCFYQWGLSSYTPVPANYDGDDKRLDDLAVFKDGIWDLLPSSGSCPTGWASFTVPGYPTACVEIFGEAGDTPVPADYDNDQKTDMAVWRPSTGDWWILASSGSCPPHIDSAGWSIGGLPVCREQWGLAGDTPLPGKFNPCPTRAGADLVVWRAESGSWWLKSASGVCPSVMDDAGTHNGKTICYQQLGLSGDVPISNIGQIFSVTRNITLAGNLDASTALNSNIPVFPQPSIDFATLASNSDFEATVDVYDSLGVKHSLLVYFFRETVGSTSDWVIQVYINGAEISSPGATSGSAYGLVEYIIVFDGDGSRIGAPPQTGDFVVSPRWSNGADVSQSIAFTLDPFSQLSAASNISSVLQDGSDGGNEGTCGL